MISLTYLMTVSNDFSCSQGLSRWIRKMKKLEEWNKFTSNCFLPAASSRQKAQTVVSWTVKVKVRVASIKQTHRMVINKRISIIQHLLGFQSIDSDKLLWLSACSSHCRTGVWQRIDCLAILVSITRLYQSFNLL